MNRRREELSEDDQARARENWRKMTPDMREFVSGLVERGMMEGRQGLAYSRVAVFPDRLPDSGGVVPYIETRAEREALAEIRNRGKRK